MKRIRASVLVAMAALASVASVPDDAQACGSAFIPHVREEAPKPAHDPAPFVATGEKHLEEGQLIAAVLASMAAFPGLRGMTPGKDALVMRALHTAALGVVRSEGDVDLGRPWSGATAAERAANLEWAVSVLRKIATMRADHPEAKTNLGEALSRLWAHQTEARALLESLAKADLMTSPEGWAALARVRGWAGDPVGRNQATAKCKAITSRDGVCEPTPARNDGARRFLPRA